MSITKPVSSRVDVVAARGLVLGMTALLAAACTDRSAPAGPESWAISAASTTSIGEAEGDSAYLFQEIVGARFTSDDGIVVADGGLMVGRGYDRGGVFVAQMGGQGAGPGEFQSLRGILVVAPDTVVAWDSRAMRLTYVGENGTPIRTVSLEPASVAIGAARLDFLAGRLKDGSFVLGTVALADELGPDRVTIERVGPEGQHLARLGEMTGLVRARLAEKVNGPIPFSPRPFVATHGDVVYYTNGSEPTVTARTSTGEQTIVFPSAEHDVEREWAAFRPMIEQTNLQPFVRVLATVPRPESIPHLAGLLVDDEGRIWVRRRRADLGEAIRSAAGCDLARRRRTSRRWHLVGRGFDW